MFLYLKRIIYFHINANHFLDSHKIQHPIISVTTNHDFGCLPFFFGKFFQEYFLRFGKENTIK